MLSAVTSPLLGSMLIGGLVLGLGAVAREVEIDQPVTRTLRLHAVDKPNEFYLSAWRDGRDIQVTFPDEELRAVTFRVRASITDGCRWQGTEQITPIDDRTFHYDYSEIILSCEPGATPTTKTPRQGTVTVE